jgi:voltage-gated sodium channel
MEAQCTSPNTMPLLAPIYFVSFVMLGAMIVLNLFIGVIMNSMQQAADELERTQERDRVADKPTLEHELFELQRAMHELTERMARVQRRAADVHVSKGDLRGA